MQKMKSLLLQNTSIENDAVKAVDWSEGGLTELDLTPTDLDEPTLSLVLNSLSALTCLSVANSDGFTDRIFQSMVKNNKTCN